MSRSYSPVAVREFTEFGDCNLSPGTSNPSESSSSALSPKELDLSLQNSYLPDISSLEKAGGFFKGINRCNSLDQTSDKESKSIIANKQSASLNGSLDFLNHSLNPCEWDLCQSKYFSRLSGIKQMHLSYSTRGEELVHTRENHSLACVPIAERLATRYEFNDRERQAVRAASLLHDVGHSLLGHGGELLLELLMGKFDHDQRGHQIVSGRTVKTILNDHGVDGQLTADILDDGFKSDSRVNFLRYLVKEVIDRCSYIPMDISGLKIPVEVKREALMWTRIYEESLHTNGNQNWLYSSNFEACKNFFSIRGLIFAEGGHHPVSRLIETILLDEGRRLLRQNTHKNQRHFEQLLNQSDLEGLEIFPAHIKQLLGRGLEDRVSCLGSWNIGDVTEKGWNLMDTEIGRQSLKEVISDQFHIPPEGVYICQTRPFSKSLKVALKAQDGRCLVDLHGNKLQQNKMLTFTPNRDKNFFLYIVANNSFMPTLDIEATTHQIQNYLVDKGILKSDAKALSKSELFGNNHQFKDNSVTKS